MLMVCVSKSMTHDVQGGNIIQLTSRYATSRYISKTSKSQSHFEYFSKFSNENINRAIKPPHTIAHHTGQVIRSN